MRRYWLVLSLLINLGLLVAIGWTYHTRALTLPVAQAGASDNQNSPLARRTVWVTNTTEILWSQITNADFTRYRDNLRQLECPELLIKRIICAEVDEQFRGRIDEVMANHVREFWDELACDLTEKSRNNEGFCPENFALVDLLAEKNNLLKEVLGDDKAGHARNSWADDFASATDGTPNASALNFLPADLSVKISAFREQQEREWNELNAQESALGTNADEHLIAEIRLKAEQSFAELNRKTLAILSPEQSSELDLRESTFNTWPRMMRSYESNHDEWLAVGKILIETYGKYEMLYATDSKLTDEERAHQEQQNYRFSQDQIRLALGDQRFAEYQRANDGDYEKTVLIAERYGLGDQVANQCYEMRRQVQKAVDGIKSDPSYGSSERVTIFQELKAETWRSFSELWGASAFETYQKYQGDWLKKTFSGFEIR